jgi:uncharacterized membrane protein YfcA
MSVVAQSMEVSIAILLAMLAAASTSILSIVGLAGGTIIVPALVLLFGLEARFAAGTTIFALIFGIFSAAIAYLRQGRVDLRLAILFDTLDVFGVGLGSYLTLVISSKDLALLMGLFLLFAAWKLWPRLEQAEKRSKRWGGRVVWRRRVITREGNVSEYELSLIELLLSQVASFFSGIATGLFGIGGGAVDATVMILIGVPPHIATATAVFGMTITKVAGVISHYLLGNVIIEYAIPMAVGAVLGGQLGPKISTKIKPQDLRKMLSVLVLLIGLRMIAFRFLQ